MKLKKLIVSDLDGTLFFIDEAVRKASMNVIGESLDYAGVRSLEDKALKSEIYDLYQSRYKSDLEPNQNLINFFKKCSNDYEIIVLSAREITLQKDTEDLLKRHKVPYNKVVLRSRSDLSIDDEVWKSEFFKNKINNYEEILFYEDKRENLKLVASNFKNVDKIKYFLVSGSKLEELSGKELSKS
ncbi:MAG: hypothetical protein GON13_01910 [Nanoarchaeota archaeon]|nr:hypothetical protein [Nanoarchaeota archaeon]